MKWGIDLNLTSLISIGSFLSSSSLIQYLTFTFSPGIFPHILLLFLNLNISSSLFSLSFKAFYSSSILYFSLWAQDIYFLISFLPYVKDCIIISKASSCFLWTFIISLSGYKFVLIVFHFVGESPFSLI